MDFTLVYETPKECTTLERKDLSSLAQLDETAFSAPLSKVTVKLVCNHRAVIFFSFALQPDPNIKDDEHLKHVKTLAFQVEVHSETIKKQIKLHTLDMDSATPIPQCYEISALTDDGTSQRFSAIEKCMKDYLKLFESAIFHVFLSRQSLGEPVQVDFDVNFALMKDPQFQYAEALNGISVEAFNRYFFCVWLQATVYLDVERSRLEENDVDMTQALLVKHCALAQSNDSSTGVYITVYLGPLKLQALCEREALLYFDFSKVIFSSDPPEQDKIQSLPRCKVAFLVDITYEEVEPGSGQRAKLDLPASRYCEALSTTSTEKNQELHSMLVAYLTEHYIQQLNSTLHGCLYLDSGAFGTDDYNDHCQTPRQDHDLKKDASGRPVENFEVDFDFITYLTQDTINATLRPLSQESFTHSRIADSENMFISAKFLKPTISLICKEDSGSVILLFNVDSGSLEDQVGHRIYNFSTWKVAFKVKLKLIDAERNDQYYSKQLVLDLSTAGFSMLNSDCPGLLDGGDNDLIRERCSALVLFVKRFYFQAIVRDGHHILCTIQNKHVITAIRYQILPFTFRDANPAEGLSDKYHDRERFGRSVIVLFGMVDSRPMPAYLPPRIKWVGGTGTDVPHGMTHFSRFLQGRVLPTLADICKATTMFPALEFVNERPRPSLINGNSKNIILDFSQVTSSEEELQFRWFNQDNVEHKGIGRDGASYSLNVECITENKVTVPMSRGANRIIVSGSVKTTLGSDSRRWNMGVTWSAAIEIFSINQQFSLNVNSINLPEFVNCWEGNAEQHDMCEPAFAQLKTQFPDTNDLLRVAADKLGAILADVPLGLYVNDTSVIFDQPMFTKKGDLTLRLTASERNTLPKQKMKYTNSPDYDIEQFINGNCVTPTDQVVTCTANDPAGRHTDHVASEDESGLMSELHLDQKAQPADNAKIDMK
ncbi:hypothetical protein K435DRAFT_876239 [Dendrothele bispora CBS 962.96]|uniref:Uncharacterized protein n=1 Tax=Dendrothele bispora (strain CBS 962.96) TaxID=1314807 RepID=A0A4V4HBC9_DENBC|nr:hypothetical protein K435DRAFT_876239 [Dendrothele bispora CBS 962.96]